MEEWVVGSGWNIAEGDCGWTWERTRNGRAERSRIDLFLSRGEKDWGEVRKQKLTSDHWALVSDIDWGEKSETLERRAVDWTGLEKEVERLKEEGIEA